MITVQAPAKINLTLEVLAKRPDGYHEIRSVIQAISLADTLRFELSSGVTFHSDMSGWRGEESLVSKAATLLQQATDCSKGAAIEVEKRIPLMAGLGGDSSDAATVLSGLNRLWELNLPQEKLLELARQLGSDVSFFLYGGTALAEGRGEIITSLPPFPRRWLVLVQPPVAPVNGKTARLYQSLNSYHFTDGQITRRLVEAITANRFTHQGQGWPFSTAYSFNTFENVAFSIFPGLAAARDHFLKLGADNVRLAGSGPALFTIAPDKSRAEELYSLLSKQQMSPYLAETI